MLKLRLGIQLSYTLSFFTLKDFLCRFHRCNPACPFGSVSKKEKNLPLIYSWRLVIPCVRNHPKYFVDYCIVCPRVLRNLLQEIEQPLLSMNFNSYPFILGFSSLCFTTSYYSTIYQLFLCKTPAKLPFGNHLSSSLLPMMSLDHFAFART